MATDKTNAGDQSPVEMQLDAVGTAVDQQSAYLRDSLTLQGKRAIDSMIATATAQAQAEAMDNLVNYARGQLQAMASFGTATVNSIDVPSLVAQPPVQVIDLGVAPMSLPASVRAALPGSTREEVSKAARRRQRRSRLTTGEASQVASQG